MEERNPLQIFPDLSGNGYAVAALAAFSLFALTIFIELRRRRREARARVRAELDEVEAVGHEKELAQEQRDALRTMIARRTPNAPLRTVTRRMVFDACVAAEIDDNRRKLDTDQLDALGEFWRAIRTALSLDFVPIGQSIASTRELYLDQRVWVAPVTGREPSQWHNATVTGVNEAHFFLTVEDGDAIPVREGGNINCRLWREDDGRYAFEAKLIRAHNQPVAWMLSHTGNLKRTQSRAHFRILYDQFAEIAIVEAPRDGVFENMRDRPEIARVQGRVTSLSGGGFAVSISQPLPPQVLLRLRLDVNGGEGPVTVVGKVVGSQPLFAGRYLVRCSFVDMSDEQRDLVTQLVFHRQTNTRTVRGAAG